jgi:hypothetical protein
MKIVCLIALGGIMSLFGASPSNDIQSDDRGGVAIAPKPGVPKRCAVASFQPEAITLFGDSATVLEKLSNLKSELPDKRLYMFVAETAGKAEVMLFEKAGGQRWTESKNVNVYRWAGSSVGDLREQISNTVLANRGIACIGEQVKSLVLRSLSTENLGQIPAPVTLRAAFAHNIKAYGNDYVRLSVFVLC